MALGRRQAGAAGGLCGGDGRFHLPQQGFQVAGPRLLQFFFDERQLTEVLDIAERMAARGGRPIGLPPVMHAHALEARQDADGVGGRGPRLACTPKWVSVAVLLTCTHWSRPATRTPVSS